MDERSGARLRREVIDGKSIVALNKDGDAERIVSVVVLDLTREDDRTFVQLGVWNGAEVFVDCQLPAVKQHYNETIKESMNRLLGHKLAPLVNSLELHHTEEHSEKKESRIYRLQTKYIRKVCSATLIAQVTLPVANPRLRESERSSRRSSSILSAAAASMWGLRRRSLSDAFGGMVAVPEMFTNREVYYIQGRSRGAFYAWVSQSEWDELRAAHAQSDLHCWIRLLSPPSDSAIDSSIICQSCDTVSGDCSAEIHSI